VPVIFRVFSRPCASSGALARTGVKSHLYKAVRAT
jgi:hypothetical protein